uniref:Uncharacterized protein n=1 Tax=Anguilla anguilla TaxID=7936 RepID=A0A0E9SZM7_ANGAN
MVVSTTNVFSK